MSSVRVLVVEEGQGVWGAQRYLLRLAPMLHERGFELLLATPPSSALAQAWRDQGRTSVDLPVTADRSIRSNGGSGRISGPRLLLEALRSTANARTIARLADQFGCRVIHGNSHWSHLESALAGRIARKPVVLHLHEESLPGIAGHMRAATVGLADATVAVCQALADRVPGWSRSRIIVIHNGVDLDVFHPGRQLPALRAEMAKDPQGFLVLAMCRLDPAKGVDHLVRAVAALPKKATHVNVAIAGAPTQGAAYEASLRKLASELLGDRVRFLGARDDVADLVRSADVFALAGSREGLPLSILEAQASGTPVIAYASAGVPEVVKDGVTGLLVPQNDIAALSSAIARLSIDALLRGRLSEAARVQVASHYTLAEQADSYAGLLRLISSRETA